MSLNTRYISAVLVFFLLRVWHEYFRRYFGNTPKPTRLQFSDDFYVVERTNEKGERVGEADSLPLFMRVARTSVGRTLNVKPALSFTRFKGLVTARNHAARVSFPHRNPLKCPFLSTPWT